MKYINVFIASSIDEFDKERIFLGNYVRKLNEQSWDRGFQIKLLLCEDEYQNSQPLYDRNIQKSDIFIAIIGQSLGEFTRHEIYDIADHCNTIKYKYIILTSNHSKELLSIRFESEFNILLFEKNLIEQLYSTLDQAISETLDKVNDITSSITPYSNKFSISIPTLNTLECAVLGNIIRRLQDQGNPIVVDNVHTTSNDAFIALISDEFESEIKRILEGIKQGVTSNQLWVFANKCIIDDTDSLTLSLLKNLTHKLQGNYYDFYQSYKMLSIIFYNKLLGALMRHNMLDGSGFIYTVADHWLIRKGATIGNNVINLLNTGYDPDSEEQARKERVIVNLLNHYWLNGSIDKHLKALEALQKSDYDYFVYLEEELEELTLKHAAYKQAVLDFIYDRLELLQLKISNFSGLETLNQINYLLGIPDKEELILASKNSFILYFIASNILLYYNSMIQTTYELFIKAWNYFKEIIHPELKIIEGAKQCILQLCSISLELNHENETIDWITEAEILIDNEDSLFKIILLTFKRAVFRNIDREIESQCIKDLQELFQPGSYNKNNTYLDLYIRYRYWCLWEDFFNIKNSSEEINTLINEYYTPYLSFDIKYLDLGIKLFSLYCLLDDDLDFCNDIITQYPDTRKSIDRSMNYYNLLYVKASILQNKAETAQAIEVYLSLSQLYQGKRDQAYCYQNIALCHMDNFNFGNSLSEAEYYYKKALSFFTELNDQNCIGNVYDGLSFCYLLQKRYTESQDCAKKAITIEAYETPNKYCNYISSLLCQNQYEEASKFFKSLNNKNLILKQLTIDTEKEITQIGIKTDLFLKFINEHGSFLN